MAATKRNAVLEALSKQLKNREEVAIPRLLNPAPVVPRGTLAWNWLLRVPRVKPARQKKKNVSNKAALQEHVGKYKVVSELANPPSGLTFGHLVHGDAEGERKDMKRLPSRRLGRSRRFAWTYGCLPVTSSCDYCSSYGPDGQALLDSGAVPNIMSPYLKKRLCLTPDSMKKHITVADGKSSPFVGSLVQVPVSFGEPVSKMDFLVVTGTPHDVIVGMPSFEELQTCIDLGQQHIQVTVGAETIGISLEMDEDCKKPGSGIDSEDFTSDSGAVPSDSTDTDEDFVLSAA